MSGVRPNATRELLARGDVALGGEAAIGWEGSVLAYAEAGLAFVWIDLEHTLLDLADAGRLIRVARLAGLTPIVRVPGPDANRIRRLVDNGAQGIILPYVEAAGAARDLVAALRFPPAGRRGVGSPRYAHDLADVPLRSHLDTDRDVLAIVQVESAAGVDACDEIAVVDGLDVVVLGLADLSVSLGARGDTEDARVVEAGAQVLTACRRAGVSGGAAGVHDLGVWVRRGARFLQGMNDVHLLAEAAARRAVELRGQLGGTA